jgi:cell division septation protein DedD
VIVSPLVETDRDELRAIVGLDSFRQGSPALGDFGQHRRIIVAGQRLSDLNGQVLPRVVVDNRQGAELLAVELPRCGPQTINVQKERPDAVTKGIRHQRNQTPNVVTKRVSKEKTSPLSKGLRKIEEITMAVATFSASTPGITVPVHIPITVSTSTAYEASPGPIRTETTAPKMVSDETLLNLIQDLKSSLKELIDDLKKERSNENEASANPRSNLKKELQDFLGKHAPKEDKNQAEHDSLLKELLRIIDEFLAANGFEDEEEDSWSDDLTHLTGRLDHLLGIIAAMEKELQKRANPTPKEGSNTPTATTSPSTEAAPKGAAANSDAPKPASTTHAPGEGETKKPAMLMAAATTEPEESTELQLNTIKGAWAFQKDHRELFERAENLIRNEWGYNDPGIMAGSDRLFGADAWLCLSALNGPNDTKWSNLDPDNKLSEKERENAITAAKTLSQFYAQFHPKIVMRDEEDAKHREVFQKVGGLGYTLLCHGVAHDKFSFSEELINSGDIEALAARLGGALYD